MVTGSMDRPVHRALMAVPFLKNPLVQSKHLIRGAHVQASHDEVIGLSLVHSELLSTIFQTEHTHVSVEAHLVDAMLPLYLAVVTRRRYTNPMVPDLHFRQGRFKGGFSRGIMGQ